MSLFGISAFHRTNRPLSFVGRRHPAPRIITATAAGGDGLTGAVASRTLKKYVGEIFLVR
jgi:hypothetical protein